MFSRIYAAILANDDLGHLTEATAMMLVLGPLAWLIGVWWMPAAVITAWYHGREKAQWEAREAKRLGLTSVYPLGHRGWWPLGWSLDQRRDLLIPSGYAWLACAGVAWASSTI